MKAFLSPFLVAGLLFAGCQKQESTPKTTNASDSAGNPITAPVDYLGAVGKAQKTASKTISAVGLRQAIQMFHAQEGRFPSELKELSPDYVGQIPPPPVGMKYSYDPKVGVVKIVPQ